MNLNLQHLHNLTTEGWLELFLTTSEKQTFLNHEEHIQDNSITHRLTSPIVQYLAKYQLPHDKIAPNLITLAGFLSLVQSWYIINSYGAIFPTSCTWFAIIVISLFFLTHSLDITLANLSKQRSALNDYFKYCCDGNSTVFLVIVTTYCLLGANVVAQWYAVQASQLVLFLKHLSGFHRNAGLRYRRVTGPGEVLLGVVCTLICRALFGLDWCLEIYRSTVHPIVRKLDLDSMYKSMTKKVESLPFSEKVMENGIDFVGGLKDNANNIQMYRDRHWDTVYDDHTQALACEAMMTLYYAMLVIAILKILQLDQKQHGWTKFGLTTSLLMRSLPAMFLRYVTSTSNSVGDELTVIDVICDGFFMAVLTSDLTLAKMAGRGIHPWVVVMSICAVLSYSSVLTLVVVYYIAVFADLCSYLNMPLLSVCRNVYCDGVYDLCHIGHKTLFRNALAFGNRLYVGVVGDKDASSYKRPPIMSHDERCAEVQACKAVTKVIQNSPCFGLTKEFLDEHQIHVVAYGQEYLERWPDPKDDPYYGYPRSIGIAKPLPRFDGLSTSDLIRRIQNARPAGERNDQ